MVVAPRYGVRILRTEWAGQNGGDDVVGSKDEMDALVREWSRAHPQGVEYDVVVYTGQDGSAPPIEAKTPIPMRLHCPNPECMKLHIDEGVFATKPHHTHACQFCGLVWRPALVETVGVRFLPGFKSGE